MRWAASHLGIERKQSHEQPLDHKNNRYLSTGEDQASTAELDSIGNWVGDWAASDNNTTTRADFKSCQDQVSDRLYYTPAMNEAGKWGLTTALSKTALYDAYINHGESGARSLIRSTSYPSSGYTVRAINPDGTWSTPSTYTYSCN